LTACGGYDKYDGDVGEDIGNDAPELEPVEDPDPVREQPPAPEPDPVWTCVYSPTYNEDWHDDVECSNGIDVDRPYLREWDSYVTQDEIMAAAAEYELSLNGG
jgi:hypothetical protein